MTRIYAPAPHPVSPLGRNRASDKFRFYET